MTEELDLRAAPGFVDEELSAELPGLRLDWMTMPRGPAIEPTALVSTARVPLQPLPRRQRGGNAHVADPACLPHVLSPDRARPGRGPDSLRAGRGVATAARRLSLTGRARGCAAGRADRDGGAGVGARCRPRRSGRAGDPHHGRRRRCSAAASRLTACRRAGWWSPTPSASTRLLFGQVAPGHGAGSRTQRIALFSVGVEGVPAIHVEEALWVCAEALRTCVDKDSPGG